MTEPGRVDLDRPRDFSALLSDATRLTLANWRTLLALAVVVVIPVHAAVLGLGLGQFDGGYNSTPAPASGLVPLLVSLLVVGPLIAVGALHVVVEASEERRASLRSTLQAAFEPFSRVFWPALMAFAGGALTFFTLIIPLVLLVRWYFVPQVVVLEKRDGTAALSGSWELTRGMGLRTAVMLIGGNILFALVGGIVATPIDALARSEDSEALRLGATALGQTLVAAPIGVFAALLYFDLRSRARARAMS